MKSIQQNYRFQASFLFYWTKAFTFFDMISGLKVIQIGNDCVTLHFYIFPGLLETSYIKMAVLKKDCIDQNQAPVFRVHLT